MQSVRSKTVSIMTEIPAFFTRENQLFSTYAFHTGVLCTKMFAVTMLTIKERKCKKACAIPGDAKIKGGEVKTNSDVERVRRAHLNDLENIPAFLFVSFLYIMTEPEPSTAVNLFRAYTGARIVHTLVYAVKPMPQPARGLAYGVGLGITTYMMVQVFRHFC